jgi:hypothetical protein
MRRLVDVGPPIDVMIDVTLPLQSPKLRANRRFTEAPRQLLAYSLSVSRSLHHLAFAVAEVRHAFVHRTLAPWSIGAGNVTDCSANGKTATTFNRPSAHQGQRHQPVTHSALNRQAPRLATNRPGLAKSIFRPIDSESDLPGDVTYGRAARGLFCPLYGPEPSALRRPRRISLCK